MEVSDLKEKWTGWAFDEISFDIAADELKEFALTCGEILPRFTDPTDTDFQAAPSYVTCLHGGKQLPDGFPMQQEASFDSGKTVEWNFPIRAGDTILARSRIHDIFEKAERSGGMMFVVHRIEFTNQDDVLVAIVDSKLIQQVG